VPLGQRKTPEYLLIDPPQKRPVQFNQLLTRNVRQCRPTLALVHQIPHGGDCRLAPAFVPELRLVGNEVEFPPTMVETALLDLITAHGTLA